VTGTIPDARVRPVRRHRVLAGFLVAALVVAGIVVLAEVLRHPLPGDAPAVPEQPVPEADPRTEVRCEEEPREGRERSAPDDDLGVREVTSNELYDCPQTWDGRQVRYRGEVVGAVLHRDGGAWVQLNDDIYGDEAGPLPAHRDYRGGNAGVAAFLPRELAGSIRHVGGPGAEGDVLEVTGTFHRVDPATREVAALRVSSGRIVVDGQTIDHPPLADRRNAAVVLGALAVAAVAAERIVARRR
jgi:hypothetical protein